jgi:hypothetical protein
MLVAQAIPNAKNCSIYPLAQPTDHENKLVLEAVGKSTFAKAWILQKKHITNDIPKTDLNWGCHQPLFK